MAAFVTTSWLITDILLVILIFLVVAYVYTTRNYKYWKSLGVPYIQPHPLVGSLWNVISGRSQIGKELGLLYRQFDGPYFGIYALDKPYLVLRSPEIIKRILIKDFSVFSNRNFGQNFSADALAANSLFILKNPDWKVLRAQLTPIFTSGKMKNMVPLMKRVGVDLQEFILRQPSDVVEMKEACVKYTTDLIASCAFGIEAKSFETEISEFRAVANRIFSFGLLRAVGLFFYFFAPKLVQLLKIKFVDDDSAHFLRKVFSETIHQREELKIKRNDFVDILLHVKKTGMANFDCDRMLSQAVTFFTAGYETTGNLISFTLYELALHPEIQERAREEILEIVDAHGDVTYESIQEMKYLNMVVAETLRKYPFGPFLNRHCDEDYLIEETGLVIEKGVSVIVPIWGIHHDPKYFPNPVDFDPERFNDENKLNIVPCSYLPFGEGPRNCIGDRFALLSGKVGIIYILSRFKVEKHVETPDWIQFHTKSPFLIPTKGLPLRLVEI